MREEITKNYEEMTAKELFHRCLDKGIECPIKKPREYYMELLKGTKTKEEAKHDVIIERIDKIQVQNDTIMSAIGNIIFVMLDRKDKLDLNVIHTTSLNDCLTSIVLELGSIQKDTETEAVNKFNRQNDEVAKEIIGAIVELFK
jgi:hypothetical protein